MFHQGLTKRKVLITREQNVVPIETRSFIENQVDSIIVNPWQLLTESEGHFHRYCAELRVPINIEIRTNFEAWFDIRGA